jgi:hypothetical protein
MKGGDQKCFSTNLRKKPEKELQRGCNSSYKRPGYINK